jgi:hypothetical protein
MKYIIILVDILYCEAQHSPTAKEIILVCLVMNGLVLVLHVSKQFIANI